MTELIPLLERTRAYEIETQSELEHIERLHRIAARTRENEQCSAEYAAQICEKLAQMERDLNAQVDRTADAKREVLVYISYLEGEERAVIEHYYCFGESWEKVAERLYMSTRRVFLLRKSALERIERHFFNKEREGGKKRGNRSKDKAAS